MPHFHSCIGPSATTLTTFVMNRQQPPSWLLAWNHLTYLLMNIELITLRHMAKMVRLGLMPRAWLTMADRQAQLEQDNNLLKLKKDPLQDPQHCSHPEWKRHGNRHGSYATCVLCHFKVKWNPAMKAWEPHAGASSSQKSCLPLPSSSNTLPASAMRATSTKAKAKARVPDPSSSPTTSTRPFTMQTGYVIPPSLPIHSEEELMDFTETGSQEHNFDWDAALPR